MWCVHCQAETDHFAPNCPYYDGTVATQPKNSAQNAIIYDSWADQWNCALCRTISDFCPLHASLNADGVKPPQSIWGKS